METPVIVGLLVIAAVWSVYLIPAVFGERRDTKLSSTDEFDRWSHSIANVQKHTADELAHSGRDIIKSRRRRTIAVLSLLAVGALFLGWRQGSVPWLLTGLFFASLIFLYLAVLNQIRQRRNLRLKVTHVAERPTEWDEPQVRVIAR